MAAGDAVMDKDYDRALQILMDAYGTEIFRFCRQMLGWRADREDWAEEVQPGMG